MFGDFFQDSILITWPILQSSSFCSFFSDGRASHPIISQIHYLPPLWGWCNGSIPASHTIVPGSIPDLSIGSEIVFRMRLKNTSHSYR